MVNHKDSMKIIIFFYSIFCFLVCNAQNVGIGVNQPISKLDVNGEIKIGMNTNTPSAGMIRFNSLTSVFEGYDGAKWISLSNTSNRWGLHDISETQSNSSLTNQTYSIFGSKVATHGNFAVVSAPWQDTLGIENVGVVYIFNKIGNLWQISDTLISPDGQTNDWFGLHVDITNDYLVVSAPNAVVGSGFPKGKVYLYKRTASSWIYEQTIIASNGSAGFTFGSDIALDNDYLAIGALGFNTYGVVYIYTRQNNIWEQIYEVNNPIFELSGGFGGSIDLCKFKLIAGSLGENKAFIFDITNGVKLDTTLKSLDTLNSELFGNSVAINGYQAIVGAPAFDIGEYQNMGSAYCYNLTDSMWVLEKIVYPNEKESYCWFGEAVSINENYALVGSRFYDTNNNFNQGRAFLFNIYNNWNLVNTLTNSDGYSGDEFGTDVSISDQSILIGAPNKTVLGQPSTGRVYFYDR